jgi:hypothetical protein
MQVMLNGGFAINLRQGKFQYDADTEQRRKNHSDSQERWNSALGSRSSSPTPDNTQECIPLEGY